MGEAVPHQDAFRLLKGKIRKSVQGLWTSRGGGVGLLRIAAFGGRPGMKEGTESWDGLVHRGLTLRLTFNVNGKQGLTCPILDKYGESVTETIHWSDTTPTLTHCVSEWHFSRGRDGPAMAL